MDVSMPNVDGTTGTVASLTMAAVSFLRMVLPETWLPSRALPGVAAIVGLGLTIALARATGKPLLQAVVDGIMNGLAATGLHQTTGMGVKPA